ncbi:hypothetical protein NDU88_004362 [Pleurodeles waltl]|uniref:Uncharacterized protein n=1 Tax=Pleurodeles waltl TaxID=8319 RepID=A0AAV7VG00_PLEWA|nr:hypothetical protein NDU88_004362 [Pleurodeles waltl]
MASEDKIKQVVWLLPDADCLDLLTAGAVLGARPTCKAADGVAAAVHACVPPPRAGAAIMQVSGWGHFGVGRVAPGGQNKAQGIRVVLKFPSKELVAAKVRHTHSECAGVA